MRIRTIAFLLLLMVSAGCAEVLNVIQSSVSVPLTEDEVVRGLKEALTIGARNSAGKLAAENGYYGDAAVKIFLPEEARVIIDNISRIPGGEQLIEDVILRINRAAEDAAREVAPIFVNSITSMTISDAFNILMGADNAATLYLKSTTTDALISLYKPKITSSTERKIIANISARDSWVALTGKWNSFANTIPGKLAGFKPVNIDLDEYLTGKALDGMFLKVEKEELKIRKEAEARVTPLLQRVFGSPDVNKM